jgi:hypothetical protein
MSTRSYKWLSKWELKEANRRAAKSAGRSIDPEYVEQLPDDLRYPIFFTLPWERHGWVRCEVGTGTTAKAEDYMAVWLDVPQFLYDNLSEITVPAE